MIMTFFALLSDLEDPMNILLSPYLEGFSQLKFPPFPVGSIHMVTTITALSKSHLLEGVGGRHPQSLSLLICPRTNDAPSAFLSADAPAVARSPA